MPVQRPRHLQPLEDRFPLGDRLPAEEPDFSPGRWSELARRSPEARISPEARVSPEEDECFSEWLAFGQQTRRDGGESLWEEPRWEEPPAHLIERLAGRLRRKRGAH